QRAQPRQHFLHPERLGDVVVGAAVDPLHLLVPASPRREHEDRQRDAGLAPPPEQRQPIDLREPEIQDGGVVPLRQAEKIRALAVARAVHGISRVRERTRELFRQPRFVFDDQDPHGLPGTYSYWLYLNAT